MHEYALLGEPSLRQGSGFPLLFRNNIIVGIVVSTARAAVYCIRREDFLFRFARKRAVVFFFFEKIVLQCRTTGFKEARRMCFVL